MKLFIFFKDDSYLNMTDGEDMHNAWLTTCAEQDLDPEEDCQDVDVYEIKSHYTMSLNKCLTPFKFTKVKS